MPDSLGSDSRIQTPITTSGLARCLRAEQAMRTTQTLISVFAAVLMALLMSPCAQAQLERPDSSRRLVRVWDFEDTLLDPRPVPRNWFRAQDNPPDRVRPGFPREWNLASVDNTTAKSGSWSIKLPTQGGSTSLMLARGVIPALPDGDYHLSAWILTDGLVHARARIVGRLLDERMNPIPGTETGSEPVITAGVWRYVGTMLRGHPNAAWIQIELNLLQPDQLHSGPRDPFEVQLQDVRGAAWFDDVAVFQIPRIEIYTTSPSGVVTAPEHPELVARVQDLTGEQLQANLQIYSEQGELVAERRDSIESSGRPLSWTPELKQFGWYRAALLVEGPNGIVGQIYTDFVWAPPKRAIDRERAWRFAMVAPAMNDQQMYGLTAQVATALSGGLYIPLWSETEVDDDTINSIVERLIELNQDIAFVLERVPVELSKDPKVTAGSVMSMLASEKDEWVAKLGPLLSKFGERVRRYQIGPVGDTSPYWRGDLQSAVPRAQERLQRVIPRPIVTLPWSIEQPIVGSVAPALSVVVPAGMPSEALEMYSPYLQDSGEVTLMLDALDPQVYGWRSATTELARKVISAWAVPNARLAIRMPWDWNVPNRQGPIPTPMLSAWRTLIEQLAERTMVGELPVADGVTAFIAQGPRGSAIIAWNTRSDPQQTVLAGYLGAGQVTVCDINGNTSKVTPVNGEHRITLGPEPLFIEGIDANLARFRAGMRVDPEFVPARASKHEIEIVITNPWDFAISGRLRLSDPEEWDITPRVSTFSIAGGETERIPVQVSFALNEEAGTRDITADVQLTADHLYPLLRVPLSVEVGLESVTMQPNVRIIAGTGGPSSDVEVTLLVTNSSDRPQTFEAYALAPGHRGQQAPISALDPGQSSVRRFVFEGAASGMRGKTIRVGLKEQNGSGRLNRTVVVP